MLRNEMSLQRHVLQSAHQLNSSLVAMWKLKERLVGWEEHETRSLYHFRRKYLGGKQRMWEDNINIHVLDMGCVLGTASVTHPIVWCCRICVHKLLCSLIMGWIRCSVNQSEWKWNYSDNSKPLWSLIPRGERSVCPLHADCSSQFPVPSLAHHPASCW
jgi:hypothetical protein